VVSDQRQREALPDVDLSSSASFEDFVEAEAPRIFAALRLVCGDRAEAEAVMLDAFMDVWDRWDRVRATGDGSADLFRTAMSTHQKRLGSDEPSRRRRSSASPGPVEALEASDEMLMALDTIKPQERFSLVLMDLFGYPSRDVGDLMGVKASTVRSFASRGRAELRKRLELVDG
jgi:RNA polymerase sigma-70 factor, ECF subfamily